MMLEAFQGDSFTPTLDGEFEGHLIHRYTG